MIVLDTPDVTKQISEVVAIALKPKKIPRTLNIGKLQNEHSYIIKKALFPSSLFEYTILNSKYSTTINFINF